MRRIVYGMGVVLTTDDVARALLRLNANAANLAHTEPVTIPIATDGHTEATADLIIGPGISMMSEPAPWHGTEPDFSTAATLLRMNPHYPYQPATGQATPTTQLEYDDWDPDLDGY